tara:strand:+ start:914 stop:1570 length:657 start_codon:yes stop_codon:yes gene_type:complete
MKPYIYSISLALATVSGLVAQTASDDNEGLVINHNGALDEISVQWWSKSSFYYFLLQTTDLVDEPWTYFPYAVLGDDSPQGIVMSLTGSKMFFRVELTDDPNSEVLLADFDGDFVTNKAELDQGTDVFDMLFSDPDLLADDWELFYFGDLTQGDSDNDDADYTNNLEESQLGLDPTADERGLALTYTYDDLGRLTGVSGNSTTLSYTLDEEGNITLTD